MIEIPSYIEKINGIFYCLLQGELDKSVFEEQCGKCKIKSKCIILKEIFKRVPGDWHGINAEGFFGQEWIDAQKDKFKRKELRDISKICGLALTYGGSSWTLSKNMQCSKELAQVRIDNFFRKLTTLSQYMRQAEYAVTQLAKVYNLFGRMRRMDRWVKPADSENLSDKEKRSRLGYAKRTALNHPIQSTSAEILKIAMIRADDLIQKKGWNPLYGQEIPQYFDLNPEEVGTVTYKNFILSILTSVHDELDFLIHENYLEAVIPDLYEIMQLKDVIKSLGVKFDLELDVEFDSSRSFTATKMYPPSKVYLLIKLLKENVDTKPNTLFFQIEDLTNDFLEYLDKFDSSSINEDEELFDIAVKAGDQIFFHGTKFPESVFISMSFKYNKAFIEPI